MERKFYLVWEIVKNMVIKKTKETNRNWKRYALFFLYSNLFIIIAFFLSLNRLKGNPIDFYFRVYLEHLIAGIEMPLLSAIILISLSLVFSPKCRKKFTKEKEFIVLIFFTILWILFEIYYQFFLKYNVDSWLQMIFFIIGIICLWIFYYFLLYRNKKNKKTEKLRKVIKSKRRTFGELKYQYKNYYRISPFIQKRGIADHNISIKKFMQSNKRYPNRYEVGRIVRGASHKTIPFRGRKGHNQRQWLRQYIYGLHGISYLKK